MPPRARLRKPLKNPQTPPLRAVLTGGLNLPALLTPVVATAFDELGVSVAFSASSELWYPIHSAPTVIALELELGVETRRWARNHRVLESVRRQGRFISDEFAGFSDLFVPVHDGIQVRGVLVAGPIARARPTSAELLQRWYRISGRQGRISDAAFSEYVSATLATLTLPGQSFEDFRRLLECLVGLVSASADPSVLAAEAHALRQKLKRARAAERMWAAARSMVSERQDRFWSAAAQSESLALLGLAAPPENAVVGLLKAGAENIHPLDDWLRRDEFQRASVELAGKFGETVAGQIGLHGVVFLVGARGGPTRTRASLLDLVNRAGALARRFGFSLHCGVCEKRGHEPLADRYSAALGAAEKALSQGLRVIGSELRTERSAELLRALRAALGRGAREKSSQLSGRFDRYIEAVLGHSGYRVEAARAHLEAGVERMTEPLLASGALDKRSFDDLCAGIERAQQNITTIDDLVKAYRLLVSDIERATENPTSARRDRATRRAAAYISEHLAEPLTLARVARVAGFAPAHFSRLFKRDEGATFEHYVRALRLERSKQMLSDSSLDIDQIQKLCGFTGRTYFHRVFKQLTGLTPNGYRRTRSTGAGI